MSRPTLSVIVITKNEAELIGQCLESVKWADEIVVVDSGSQDATVDICRRYTDKVVVTDWPGFGPQKNRALDLATGDWVLSIDADEEVSPELAQEIQRVLQTPTAQGYTLSRLSSYCGRFMRHSGWWPDPVLRLFQRNAGRFTDARVHERVVVQGTVRALHATLLHHSYRSLDQVLHKVNHYSHESALALQAKGRRAGLSTAIGHGLWTFIRTYIFKAGFLDGREGFILAVSNAEGTYYRYLKLMYLLEKASKR
jgi:glycosyltransferase involved in cell wall biosynthesis